ncbi:MAG TPA: hypothetical protein DCM14_06525 [Clostridiales bacterium UBA8153]|nr:hypothetical protein [Clostridiales bacterium UBA8153]
MAKPESGQAVSPDILEVGAPGPLRRAEIEMNVKEGGRPTGINLGQVKVIQVTVKRARGDLGGALFAGRWPAGSTGSSARMTGICAEHHPERRQACSGAVWSRLPRGCAWKPRWMGRVPSAGSWSRLPPAIWW